MIKKYLLIISISFSLFSCAADQEMQKTRSDLYSLNSYTINLNGKVTKLEEKVNALSDKIDKMNITFKASQKLQYNELSSDISTIKNQLNDLKSLDKAYNADAGQNSEATEVTKEAIKDIYSKIYTLENEIKNLKNGSQINTLEKKQPVNSEGFLYKKAYSLFTSGKYSESEKAFKEFIKKFPKSVLLPNAYYWLGETFYKRKMYEKAIINYDEVIVKYSKSRKVPAALLKEGISFLAIGEKDGARLIFRKILKDYRKSPQAKYAKRYLRKLKK